ncbi:MAG: MFS transporter [Mycobacterium sp.]
MRWFLPLMVTGGVAMSLTAPLEVVFAREYLRSGLLIGSFMLAAAAGMIVVDVFGTRFVPGLDARFALTVGLILFGVASIGMGLTTDRALLMASRVMQGVGAGTVLGAGLQAAVRVRPVGVDLAHALGRFNAALLFGGAIGAPGGLLAAGLIDGRLGYQTAFVVTGALTLVVAACLAIALPRLAPPANVSPPRLGLPRLISTPANRAALVLAMSGDFLRGGVLLTALPLAGAARGYSILTISIAIALMSGVEIVVLTIAYRFVRGDAVVSILGASFGLGIVCAAMLALTSGEGMYLMASALFGVSLAGATVSLPLLVVACVGESSAGLAQFRISAGVGFLAGSAGCAVLGAHVGSLVLFGFIALVLAASALLTRIVGQRSIPT